jgi:hypothetical protein
MSGVSPSSVLFSSDGTELAVVNNAIVPAGTRALLIAGINTQNRTDYVPASLGGALGTVSMSANIPVQTAATVTASGSFTTDLGSFLGTQEIALIVNVGTVTGAGSIQYTIQEVDPQDNLTVYGNSATTVVINSGNTPAVFTAVLPVTTSSQFKVTWTVTGTFSATIYSTITTKETPSTQTVNGTVNVGTVSGTVTVAGTVAVSSVGGTVAVTQSTSPWVVSGTVTSNQGTPNSLANAWPITLTDGYGNIQGSSANPIWIQGSISATNPSVGTDGAAALGFDTQVGGKVTTAAPTYTNGNLDALSLTTLGGLRIDGVYAGGTANATAADQMVSGAYVTTAAPTYTTGQLNALSLTTLGGLRIDGVYAVATANATAADVANVGGYVTTAAPTYTTGQLNPLSLDTSGNLRVTGVVTTNKATTSNVTSVSVTANANNSLLAAQATRQFASVFNNTNKTLYIKCGATASTSSFTTQLFTGSYWEVPVDWTGAVDAFAPTGATGSILVTELTP